MAQSKRERYESQRRWLHDLVEQGEIAEADADAILELCDAYDAENVVATPNDSSRWGDERAPSTLRQWIVSIAGFARDLDKPIVDASAYELNQVAQRMYDGEAVHVTKPLSRNTVRVSQNCLKRFLRHADAVADVDDIATFGAEGHAIDPSDMLTQEEFHALRNAPEHPRDKAIVDLFLYTGQRNTAIRTLRVGDIELGEARYRLNDEADGLKGAELVGTWNPLLGAVGSVRDWLRHHPAPDDPEAFLLCSRRSSAPVSRLEEGTVAGRDPYSSISDDTINRVLRDAAAIAAEEEPGITDKPVNAHTMRHNFVTMCKVVYDLDDDVIKRLIRHKPGSNVMNTTYAHLSDADYIAEAEKAFGLREEEDDSISTPPHCNVCNEPLPPSAKACPKCGVVFTPDAVEAMRQLEDDVKQDYRETPPDEEEVLDAVDAVDDLLDDPKVKAQLLERWGITEG